MFLNTSKKLLRINFQRIVIYEARANVRLESSDGRKHVKSEPVNLSYASYESTQNNLGEKGAPLIIMHGLFGSKGNWNSLCKAMHARTSPQRKIVAVDARNHGDSPHSTRHTYNDLILDVHELMQSQGIAKACLMGHSMGGRALMLFALKYPDFVEKLIVVDISPVSTSSSMEGMFKIFDAMRNVTVDKNVPLSTGRQQADHILSSAITDKGVRAFILTNLVRNSDGSFAWRVNLDVLASNYHNIVTFPKTENLKYEGPTLFVAGGTSDFIQRRDHMEIKKLFPNSEFQEISGAGHWVHSEKPREFLNVILNFLNNNVI